MNYNKPEIVVLGSANLTIQGSRVISGDAGGDLLQGPTDCELDD
jgi:hypothetical protein